MRTSAVCRLLAFVWTGVLSLHTNAQPALTASTPAQIEVPSQAHLEVMLSGSKGVLLNEGALASSLPLLREQGFLDGPAIATADPLAPCALLTAVVSADLLNRMFFGLIRPGGFDFRPPPGTNILGMYDSALAGARGAIPREDPAKAADMLARSVVGRSWGISGMMNTLLAPMKQGRCVEMLVSPKLLEEAIEGYTRRARSEGVVMTHAAPVSAFILSVDKSQGQPWLDELLEPGILDKPARPADNPLAPCALLSMFRVAARLNDAWRNTLPAGKFDLAGRGELAPYAQSLQKPLETAGNATAELLAVVFDAEIRRANWLTDQLTMGATQRECLDELFAPGGLRLKLMRSGKMLPLR